MWNTKQYDIIVVGAGPSGSTFARIAASNGLSVLLLEKKSKIGIPVRCGEAVLASGLRLFYKPRPEWIDATINKFRFVAPDGNSTTVQFQEEGYILNRKIFDNDLALIAKKDGAVVVTDAYVNGLLIKNNKVLGAKVVYKNELFEIKSKLVIGADGVESRIGQMAGINTKINLNDIGSGYQKTISGIKIKKNVCSFYISNKLAPGGYIWIFPKGNDTANIGIGLSGKSLINGESAKQRLNKFIDSKYPNYKVESITVGGIAHSKPIKQMVTNGVMLIGDAGRTTDPLSGGGIITGMESAVRASEVAIKVLNNSEKPSKINLIEYQKRWMKNEGNRNNRLYRIKKVIVKLTDMDLNNIANKVNKIPNEKRSLTKLFLAAVPKKPSLIFDVFKVFVGYK